MQLPNIPTDTRSGAWNERGRCDVDELFGLMGWLIKKNAGNAFPKGHWDGGTGCGRKGKAQESDPNLAGHLPAHIQYQVFVSRNKRLKTMFSVM